MLWRFEVVGYQAVGTALFCLFWIQMLCDCWMGLLENVSLSDHSSLEVWKPGSLLGWSFVIVHSHFRCNLLGWWYEPALCFTIDSNSPLKLHPYRITQNSELQPHNSFFLSFVRLIGSTQAMYTCSAFSLITSGFLLCYCLKGKVLRIQLI